MKRNIRSLILFAVFFAACHRSTIKEQTYQPVTFTSEELGWTITIPEGYQALSENRARSNYKKGKAAIESAKGEKIQTDSLVHLVNFQKNQFNSLNATLQHYNEKANGDYVQSNELTKKAIYEAYTQRRIKIDTASFKEVFAGHPFYGFLIKIYGPNREIMMSQIMLSQLIKGYDFCVNINYNNETDKKTLIEAFKNSSF